MKHLIEIHVLTPKTYDQAVMEFKNFLYSKAKNHQFQFSGFGTVKNKPLDHFQLKNVKIIKYIQVDYGNQPWSSSCGA